MKGYYLTSDEIESFSNHLREEEKSENTMKKYIRDVKAFSDFCTGIITKDTVIAYKQSLIDDGYTARSINSMLASVNSLFSFLSWYELRVKTLKIQQQVFCSEEKELTRPEYERLCRTAERKHNERLCLILQTICGTGMNDKKYEEAIATFEALDGYKDSERQIENCYIEKFGEEKWNKIKKINVGDTYTFGAYEQDNNTSNGKEAIEWTVLEKNDMSLLLISKQALDYQQYNTSLFADATWDNSSLRKWLNNTFLVKAFNEEEQTQIQNTTVTADENPMFDTYPGTTTKDKVFLLSAVEAKTYFSSNSSRICKPTKYALANGAHVDSGNGDCYWWLRSPGAFQDFAAGVRSDGSIYYYGCGVKYDGSDYSGGDFASGGYAAVRPALWINLE